MRQKLRILIAEEPGGKAASVLRELFSREQNGLELTEVSGVPMLMATLEGSDPEVILLDLALARSDVREVVRRLHRAKPAAPLVVIGETAEKETFKESVREGAAGCLLKGQMDATSVHRVLRRALERNTLKGLADLLRDALTGLYIRDGFLTLGEHAMEAAKYKGGDLVLLCAQIESLDSIQKESGHNAVEASLKEIATMLSQSFRRTDLLGRIGKSQFAALAVDAVEPSAPVLLQRVRKRLEALNRDIAPRRPLELRMTARFWPKKEGGTFAEFLDEVEAGLRSVETPTEGNRNCAAPFQTTEEHGYD